MRKNNNQFIVRDDKMKCLKINKKWLDLILNGEKDLELRRVKSNYSGQLALGEIESKQVVGYATLFTCLEFTREQLDSFANRHKASDFLDEYMKDRDTLYGYFLKNVRREPKPYPYSFSTGSWCTANKLTGE
jgi:hypothetical protein